jgi:probable rRNA maturation factor
VLMLHGLLHLAGFDHETDTGQMARRERSLRAKLNLPQGLIERTSNPPRPSRAPSSRLVPVASVGNPKSRSSGNGTAKRSKSV